MFIGFIQFLKERELKLGHLFVPFVKYRRECGMGWLEIVDSLDYFRETEAKIKNFKFD